MRFPDGLVALALLLAIAASGAVIWLVRYAHQPGPATADITVDIAAGAGVNRIASVLEAEGVIDHAALFEIFVRLRGESAALRAGEYEMQAAITPREVLRVLIEGKTTARRITVPEGYTVTETMALIEASDGLTGALPAMPEEGSLLPETYHYSKGNSRADMVARMQALAGETLERLWNARADDLPFDTPREAVILASIIEKETGVAGERAHIAGVFVNRLRIGMPLQSDPTVIYAVTQGKAPLGRSLTRRDLAFESPYNTYRNAGLPPGPIANPGRAALEAALHPMATRDLYFVADGSGGHAFARTLDEHNRNAARWRRIQRERGER